MDGLGFLSLGARAGMTTGQLMFRSRMPSKLGFVLVALLPVPFSGSAVFMLPQLVEVKSSSLYPVGLLLSLMWQQAGVARVGRGPTQAESIVRLLVWRFYAAPDRSCADSNLR